MYTFLSQTHTHTVAGLFLLHMLVRSWWFPPTFGARTNCGSDNNNIGITSSDGNNNQQQQQQRPCLNNNNLFISSATVAGSESSILSSSVTVPHSSNIRMRNWAYAEEACFIRALARSASFLCVAQRPKLDTHTRRRPFTKHTR